MKKIVFLLLVTFPLITFAQGQKGSTDCAPTQNGKIVYTDTENIKNASRDKIFEAINAWAKKSFTKDIFLSNHSANKSNATIQVSSKIELLLNETDKTNIKYKMLISCYDNKYTVEVKDITYQYDPHNNKKYKTYKAEDVILNNGKSNKITLIKDPELFCNATFFFVESLFADVHEAAKDAE